MASLMPVAKQQYFYPGTALPLVGGTLYTYAAGTSTPKTTWQDAAGTTPNTNPITLDSTGSALIYWTGNYKVVLKDSLGNTVYTVDNYNTDLVAQFQSQLAAASGASLIGFSQSGTGAILRTLQDELRDRSVSIADFGATTGSTDNSAALQNAINLARSVYIPDGVWPVTASVSLLDGAFIWGPGTIQRTNAGPIFTASGNTDITVIGIGLKGDVNSLALQFGNCNKVRVIQNRCQEIMLVEMNSATGAYDTTTDSNMSRDVVVYGNTGVVTLTPNAVSQQFIRILYTRDFSVCNNSGRGYRDLVLAWGGDYTVSGAAANERKCFDGLIEGNRGNVLAAGIWTGMAQRIRIVGNQLYGNAFAEGLDAEGSTDITFEANDVVNFADGLAAFGLNRNIRYKNNNVQATANAFRNANSTFYADYGLLEFDGNSFKSLAASACIAWVTSAAGRMRLTDNDFENVVITLTDVAIADAVILDNELYYDYAPSGLWFVRLGGLASGYTVQPKLSQFVFKRNLIEWRGTGVSSKRAVGLTSSAVAHLVDIQENTFIGINEQISYEGSTGAMTVLAKRNTFDLNATYPSVLHGASTGMTVIWQDNDRSDGLDAYGTNTPSSSFFSAGSRIWSNTPANGAAPGWIYRSGVWGPMAAIG